MCVKKSLQFVVCAHKHTHVYTHTNRQRVQTHTHVYTHKHRQHIDRQVESYQERNDRVLGCTLSCTHVHSREALERQSTGYSTLVPYLVCWYIHGMHNRIPEYPNSLIYPKHMHACPVCAYTRHANTSCMFRNWTTMPSWSHTFRSWLLGI